MQCVQCGARKTITNSNEKPIRPSGMSTRGKGVKQINLETVASASYSSLTYGKYSKYEGTRGINPINRSSFYRMSELIWEHAEAIAVKSFDEVCTILKERGEKLVCCVDCGWAKRGWTSTQGAYVVWEATTQKVLKVITLETERSLIRGESEYIVREGNYEGSSGGMEVKALGQFLDWMKDRELLENVATIVMDKDSSAPVYIKNREDCRHIEVKFDPGHVKKSLQKQLITLFGQGKKYEKLPQRIASWFMRVLKNSEKLYPNDRVAMCKEFLRQWSFTYEHYTRAVCPMDCPCAEQATIPKIEPEEVQLFPVDILVELFKRFDCRTHLIAVNLSRYFYAVGSQPSLRKFYYKPDKIWLNKNNQKDKLFLEGNPHGKTRLRQIGLRLLIDKVKEDHRQFVHGFNTTRTESLHNERQGLTDKRLDLWNSWSSRTLYQLSKPNMGRYEHFARLWDSLCLPISSNVQQFVQNLDEREKVQSSSRKTHEYVAQKKRRSVQKEQKKSQQKSFSKSKGQTYKTKKVDCRDPFQNFCLL